MSNLEDFFKTETENMSTLYKIEKILEDTTVGQNKILDKELIKNYEFLIIVLMDGGKLSSVNLAGWNNMNFANRLKYPITGRCGAVFVALVENNHKDVTYTVADIAEKGHINNITTDSIIEPKYLDNNILKHFPVKSAGGIYASAESYLTARPSNATTTKIGKASITLPSAGGGQGYKAQNELGYFNSKHQYYSIIKQIYPPQEGAVAIFGIKEVKLWEGQL